MPTKLASIVVALATLWLSSSLPARPQVTKAPSAGKGTLEMVVVDEAGKALAGTRVSLPGHRSTTGSGGSCQFRVLPGRYSVLISKEGYRGRRINAGVRPGETTTTRVQLQKLSPARPPRK